MCIHLIYSSVSSRACLPVHASMPHPDMCCHTCAHVMYILTAHISITCISFDKFTATCAQYSYPGWSEVVYWLGKGFWLDVLPPLRGWHGVGQKMALNSQLRRYWGMNFSGGNWLGWNWNSGWVNCCWGREKGPWKFNSTVEPLVYEKRKKRNRKNTLRKA